MDAFSYLSVLLAVIIGLAVTQVLQGYRALALARRKLHWYAPPLIWSVLILILVTQHWWASFGLARRSEWSFVQFGATLVQTALLYMMAALVLPDSRPMRILTSNPIIIARRRSSSASAQRRFCGI